MNDLIRIEHDLPYIDASTLTEIIDNEKQLKALKERQDTLKDALLREMEEKDIRKIDTSFITISRIDATEREKFNSKQFRTDNPSLYDKYISFESVKASIRLTVKKNG